MKSSNSIEKYWLVDNLEIELRAYSFNLDYYTLIEAIEKVEKAKYSWLKNKDVASIDTKTKTAVTHNIDKYILVLRKRLDKATLLDKLYIE